MTRLALVALSVLLFGCGQPTSLPAAPPRPARVHNPLFEGADPDARVFGNAFWVYPTGSSPGHENFFAWRSPDLVTWERVGPILDFAGVKWIRDDGRPDHGPWAPCVIERGGRWYFYYSAGPQHPTPSRIGVAVGPSPAGPFVDSGRPLLTGEEGFEAIDPMVFQDPAGGKWYLYAGGSAGAKLRVYELGPDLVSILREEKVETPPQFTEGSFIHERGGIYHFTYSHGDYRRSSYSLHYATSGSPLGPWTYRGAILVSDVRHKGPGHHSIVRHPLSGKEYLVYHRWNAREGDGPYQGRRSVAIEELHYGEDGLLRPVTMTDEGPPADPLEPRDRR